jgi:hypothetical protein
MCNRCFGWGYFAAAQVTNSAAFVWSPCKDCMPKTSNDNTKPDVHRTIADNKLPERPGTNGL